MTDLTFVVPTIPGRESLLSRCLYWLQNQMWHEWSGAVETEILVVAGTGRLGDKVNAAAAEAGAYMTVVDDDDYVTAGYLAAVTPDLCRGVDYMGLGVLELHNGQFRRITHTVGDSRSWTRLPRGPVPKGITRTEIVRKVQMGNEWKADRAWLAEVARHIGTCEATDEAIYVYDAWDVSSAFGGRGTRDVGMWPFDEGQVRRIVVDR